MTKIIKTLEELKKLASRPEGCDCFIVLGGGIAKSSKHIVYDDEGWFIYNEIDDTETKAKTWEELKPISNVPEALSKRALIDYE